MDMDSFRHRHAFCRQPNLPALRDLLARDILRLRSRAAEDLARDAAQVGGRGEVRLHSTARQRLHANPNRKGLA